MCCSPPAAPGRIKSQCKDGDRITGAIVKKDGQTLTVQSTNFGLVTVKWEDIATIRTEQPLNIVLAGERTVKADIRLQDGRVEIAAPGAAQTAGAAEIVALRSDSEQRAYERLVRPGVFDLWTITGGLNIAGVRGNAATSTLTTPVNFLRVSKTSRTSAYFNSIRSKATVDGVSSSTARAVRGGWAYGRNLTRKVLLNTFNDYEYDEFQSLDLRVVLGGGLGYQLWTAEAGRLATAAGAAWDRERFSPASRAAFTRNSAEAYWGNDFNYKLNSRTSLVQGFRMFNNLSETGEYRVNFDIGASTQLTRWLAWTLSLSDRYLSNPVAGRKNNDLLYSTGFGFTFAR